MSGAPASCARKGPLRILLVDDQPAVRQGLKMRLTLEPDLVVVGEAGDGAEAIRLARELCPDLVLMDVRMPGEDGISLTRRLREITPRSAILILSLYDDFHTRRRAQEAGAAAFVAKQGGERVLLPTLRRLRVRERNSHSHEDRSEESTVL